MNTNRQKQSKATKYLEKLSGGPLTLAKFLTSVRKCDELTYEEFAKKLGISKSHLCDIEKGRKAVSLTRAIEFAAILGYSKDQFAELALQSQVTSAGLKLKVTVEAA